MIDYEEMNEVLRQADREFAEKARMDRREQQAEQEQSYEACMEILRRTKEHIERIREGVKEEYAEAVKADESANRELIGAVYGLALHTIAFPIIAWYFALFHVLIAILCGIAMIFWAFSTITFVKKVLNVYTTHIVMTSKPAAEEYAQEFRIPTYRARKSKCEKRLQLLKDRMAQLDAYEQQIERRHGLSNEDYEAMQLLREVPKEQETFSDKTEVTFREFRGWKNRRKGESDGLR